MAYIREYPPPPGMSSNIITQPLLLKYKKKKDLRLTVLKGREPFASISDAEPKVASIAGTLATERILRVQPSYFILFLTSIRAVVSCRSLFLRIPYPNCLCTQRCSKRPGA